MNNNKGIHILDQIIKNQYRKKSLVICKIYVK